LVGDWLKKIDWRLVGKDWLEIGAKEEIRNFGLSKIKYV